MAEKSNNTMLLVETLIEIIRAKKEGRVFCGEVAGIRFNSEDNLALDDMEKLLREIWHNLLTIQVNFRILDAKARSGFVDAAPSQEARAARHDIFERMQNLVTFVTDAETDEADKAAV